MYLITFLWQTRRQFNVSSNFLLKFYQFSKLLSEWNIKLNKYLIHHILAFTSFLIYIYIYIYIYRERERERETEWDKAQSTVLQYFGNLFALFFNLQQKQLSIQNRGHHAAPFEISFLPVFWSQDDSSSCPSIWKIPLSKLLHRLGCWSAERLGSEPWIRARIIQRS